MRIRGLLVSMAFGTLGSSALSGAATAQGAEWAVREELRIGDGTSIDKLPRINRLITGRDGRAYALTGTEIIIFDRTGKLVRRVATATSTQLQNELQELTRARSRELEQLRPDGTSSWSIAWRQLPSETTFGWVGDTLWLARSGTQSIALLGPSLDTIGAIPFASAIDGRPADFPLALLADRSLLRTISSSAGAGDARVHVGPPGNGRYQMPVVPGPPPLTDEEDPARGFLLRASPGGSVLQGLEIFFERRPPVVVRNPYGATASIPFPFQDHPLIAVTPDGSEIVFVERYAAQRPAQASYSVVRFDARSGKRTSRAYPYVPMPITPATGDSVWRSLVDGPGSPLSQRFLQGFSSMAAARAAVLRPLDAAKYHTPITDVVAGADRTVWLREQRDGRWVVLATDGSVLGRIALPTGARVLQADADTAWVLLGDVPGPLPTRVLIRYRIVKP